MKWIKLSVLFLLSCGLFLFIFPFKKVEAVPRYSSSDNIFLYIDNSGNGYSYIFAGYGSFTLSNGYVNGISYYYQTRDASQIFTALNNYLSGSLSLTYGGSNFGHLYSPTNTYILIQGSWNLTGDNVYDSMQDYEDSLNPSDPSWWDNVKQAFMDFVGSDTMSAVISGDWLSYIDEVLFGELWTVKVGEGEDDIIVPETISATPTPSPNPIPTPIPYSTVIDPGTGEITYHYTIEVSGTPVPTSSIYPPVTSSPPGPGSGSTIDEPVAVEDYYEPDDSLSVPKLRIFKFLLRMTGNDVDVGMDSLDNNMAVMDATLDDNAEAISGVGDLFQVIPVKWFILVGTLACFPVIAAMIKSLLGG